MLVGARMQLAFYDGIFIGLKSNFCKIKVKVEKKNKGNNFFCKITVRERMQFEFFELIFNELKNNFSLLFTNSWASEKMHLDIFECIFIEL